MSRGDRFYEVVTQMRNRHLENGLNNKENKEKIQDGEINHLINNLPSQMKKNKKFSLQNTNLIEKITDSLLNRGNSPHLNSHFKKNFNLLEKIVENPLQIKNHNSNIKYRENISDNSYNQKYKQNINDSPSNKSKKLSNQQLYNYNTTLIPQINLLKLLKLLINSFK